MSEKEEVSITLKAKLVAYEFEKIAGIFDKNKHKIVIFFNGDLDAPVSFPPKNWIYYEKKRNFMFVSNYYFLNETAVAFSIPHCLNYFIFDTTLISNFYSLKLVSKNCSIKKIREPNKIDIEHLTHKMFKC